MTKPKLSAISWTDYSAGDANFVIGCTPASEGCANCYGQGWANRIKRDYSKITLYPEKLERLGRFRPTGTFKRGAGSKPMIFICDISDLFHRRVPDHFILRALDVLRANSAVDWQILTKRIERAAELLQHWGKLPEHMWIGATCENQRRYNQRKPVLDGIDAEVRWISMEPILGWINPWGLDLIRWVVVGAETERGRRHYDKLWAKLVRDTCDTWRIPFYYKQSAALRPGCDPYLDGVLRWSWPETARVAEVIQPVLV